MWTEFIIFQPVLRVSHMPLQLGSVRYVRLPSTLTWTSICGYWPGAFSSCTGIFHTSGRRDSSRVSSSSRQVNSWECNKTHWGYLESSPCLPPFGNTLTLPSRQTLVHAQHKCPFRFHYFKQREFSYFKICFVWMHLFPQNVFIPGVSYVFVDLCATVHFS